MINNEVVDAFNSRLTVNITAIKNMSVEQQDRVKTHGATAEQLLKNKDLALFIHQYKFELADQLAEIAGYTDEDNNKRIAIGNKLAGVNGFIDTLKQAVYYKNTVVKQQNAPTDSN